MRSEAFLYWIIEVGVRSRIANRDGRWEAEEEAGEVNVLCGVEVNVRLLDWFAKNTARKRTSGCLYYVAGCESVRQERNCVQFLESLEFDLGNCFECYLIDLWKKGV